MASNREQALEALDSSFEFYGFRSTPPGLRCIFSRFSRQPNESVEKARKRLYKRLFGILWFGNKVGQGQFRGKLLPTYVYPECIKEVVRSLLDENIRDYHDPQGSAVYHVTVRDLFQARWPAGPR